MEAESLMTILREKTIMLQDLLSGISLVNNFKYQNADFKYRGTILARTSGALDGGLPMSHVDFKK